MTCHFSGHVQGVGFRYTVRQLATRYPISGYVRNLSDGRVELVMEGAEPEINKLLNDIREAMEAHINHTDCQSAPATGEFRNFEIRH